MIDFKTVASAALSALPDLLPQWLPNGRRHGHEFTVGSLRGEPGDSCSINIRSGAWCDFSTGEKGGDPISLYAGIYGLKQAEAARELAKLLGLESGEAMQRAAVIAQAKAAEPKPSDFRQIVPVPAEVMDAKPNHKRLGAPAVVWGYHTREGALIGYICRFNKPDGKEYLPYAYGELDGKTGWHWKSFNDPRPLWNLPALNREAPVLICEGEKAASHAATLFPQLACMTWPGGSKAWQKADWNPLAGRQVVISPDADEPGYKCAQGIADRLRGLGCSVKFCPPPEGAADGWDLADSDLTAETALPWLRARLTDELSGFSEQLQSVQQLPIRANSPQLKPVESEGVTADDYAGMEPDYGPPPGEPEDELHIAPPFVLDRAPFKCLGFDKEFFYYFAHGRQQVIELTAAAHTTNNLLKLASRFYWKQEFPKGRSDGFDLEAATDALMRGCENAGIYNPDRMRGRGAWYDDGRVVIHLGNRVIVDGHEMPPAKVQSRFAYEAADPIDADFSKPLGNKEANRVVQLFEMLPWERPIQAKLAAGWCVVAHVGGVLRWRPHIWVIGRRGSGKTYVMANIIKPLLVNNCVQVQGGSTEAGIRQQLGVDSLPVWFDEAEGEDQAAHQNIQRVLGLIRQSSSETGGKIAKGTPGGKALKFNIRSPFAMSSINANLVQSSDKSRVTVLEINKDHARHAFPDIQAAERELLQPEFCQRFYARAIGLAAVIRENAVTFARAAAEVLGEQRAGDQIGALLAGCYALYSERAITLEEAKAWVAKQDWSETRDDIHSESDEARLWSHLMEQKLHIKLDANGSEELAVGELIDIARGEHDYAGLSQPSAHRALLREGFRVDPTGTHVSNTHAQIRRMLQGTQWASNWGRVLKRLPGAYATGPLYFGNNNTLSRAMFVPTGQ